jgi:putative colanic acid biosynthesis glycosyltransferase
LRIIQINTTVNSGSTGRIAEDIGKGLMENGHESYIAYGRGSGISQSYLIKVGNQTDIILHGIKTAVLDRHGFGSRTATKKLIDEIDRIKPDAIGLHNIHGYYLNVEILFDYLYKVKIPVVWTLHDCWAFTGHCTYYDSIGCEKWKTLCQVCPKKKFYPSSYGLDQSKKNHLDKQRLFNQLNNLHLITPSRWLSNEVRQSRLDFQSAHVIHNGIDLEVFKPQDQEFIKKHINGIHFFGDKKIILGCASIWDKRKGLDDFIQLSYLFDENHKIVLIGLNADQISKLPKGILGISRTESIEELAAWYSTADVFVNPTYQDNFPTTNLEALACGTPVITYNTGGSPEAIDEETGMVVEKGNLPALKTAIELITAKGKTHYQSLCRARAEKYFNKNERYLDYLHLYESLVNG